MFLLLDLTYLLLNIKNIWFYFVLLLHDVAAQPYFLCCRQAGALHRAGRFIAAAGPGCYSSRIASTGLMLMARMAGAKPAKTPSTERKMVAPTAVQKLI